MDSSGYLSLEVNILIFFLIYIHFSSPPYYKKMFKGVIFLWGCLLVGGLWGGLRGTKIFSSPGSRGNGVVASAFLKYQKRLDSQVSPVLLKKARHHVNSSTPGDFNKVM